MNKKILFVSLGCDKNLVDSEMMLGMLLKSGYEFTDDEREADVVVVNTCCFINDAKEESINTILEMAKLRESGAIEGLIVAGCLAQRYREEIQKEIPEVDALVEAGADIIALDATDRKRAGDVTIKELFPQIREKYPDMLFMADCSTYEDALQAQELGFDFAGTTLCGYTKETEGTEIPCYELLRKMCGNLKIPVIAEGGIWERGQLQEAFACGIHAAVVGTAITRPREITRRFVDAIPN